MTNYLKLWKKFLALELQAEMMYKLNFIFKIVSFIIADIIAPIITLLIYTTTPGIPGWSFPEFILFQGSFIIVFGLAHLFVMGMPAQVIEAVRDGSFDKYLVQPVKPLWHLTLSAWDLEGAAEVMTGLVLIGWAMSQLQLAAINIAIYPIFILLGLLFIYSLMIIIAALAFLVVKSWALYDIFFKLSDFGRYPLTIYEGTLRFFLTLIIPIGLVAFYPAEVMVRGGIGHNLLMAGVPVIILFGVALVLWRAAMKKYSSAGG